jgi:glycosyltransferase involved in cell wall biosynthesis
MRIAFVSTILFYPWGGADTLWTKAAEDASRRGDALLLCVSPIVAVHARIIALRDAGAQLQTRSNPPAVPSYRDRLRRRLGWARSADAELIIALKDFRPDLVVFSQGGTYDLVAHSTLTTWLRSEKIPYRIVVNWQQEHPDLTEPHLSEIRETFIAADRLFFVSTRNLAVTRRHLLAALPNACLIQNPLRWQPSDITPWPADTGIARLATVSRLDHGKGIHLLLHALAESGTELPPWNLDIFGQGPDEEKLRALSTYLGLAERVRFCGYLSALRTVWADSEMLVSAAIDDGVPMTIPEAMLCGRPVIATCVGGAEDWIESETTGFLCPAPTVPLLMIALVEGMRKKQAWPAMGLAASVAASARYQAADHLKLIA